MRKTETNELCPPYGRGFPLQRSSIVIGVLVQFIVSCLFVNFADATVYYVSNCGAVGDDSNTGTSQANAWRSIQKVNSTPFLAGDSVLFRRECIWRDKLIITSTGAAGAALTFGAYGSGAAPIISGADLGTNWSSENIVVNSTTVTVYYTTVSEKPLQVYQDEQRLVSVQSKNELVLGSFTWDSSNSRVYLRTKNGSNPSGHKIEISQRKNGILSECSNRKETIISDLQIEKVQDHGIYFCGSSHVSFTNVTVLKNFGEGLRLDATSDVAIRSSTAAFNGASGVAFYHTPGILIDSVVAHDNAQLDDIEYTAGIKGHPSRASINITIQNSISYSNGLGKSSTRGSGIWIDTVGDGAIIRYNNTYDNNSKGIDLNSVNYAETYGNLSYDNGIGLAAYADAEPSMTGNQIYNNTIYGNREYGIFMLGPYPAVGGPASCANNIVQNNISVGTVSGPNFAAFFNCENPGVNGFGNIYTYNNFGPENPKLVQWGGSFGNITYLGTYSAFNTAYGADTHSIPGDPQFTDTASKNFTLRAGSPAIDAGINLGNKFSNGLEVKTSWPSSVSLVNHGSYGANWDLGAYVYTQGSLRSPRNLRTAKSN